MTDLPPEISSEKLIAASGRLRAFGSRWLAERKRLYHEHEWIREVDAQTKTLVSELHARRDGQPARTFNLWAIRGALAEVDHADSEGGL